ncbi:MAG: hypothetical protein GXY52_05325 [Chloroflexi bacterium]|nr:hypothetical protein [Chloroflexota bacterium]
MQPLPFADVRVTSGLRSRALLNYDRLELPNYEPQAAFQPIEYDWPGDTEGRVLMAWILLAQATHREPRFLDAMLAELPAHFNELGYMGPILPDGEYDEQQLSGHGWVLRALCEYYLWRPNDQIRAMMEGIIRGLFLPVRGYYKLYPSRPEDRSYQGQVIGQAARRLVGHWYPSTDIGSGFTILDGATQAYQILRWPELAEVIEEGIAAYGAIDKVKVSFQTHSTLSTCRAVLRYYTTVGREQDLTLARSIYQLYRTQAITANWANYNWFGRPHWTEPCAVIDSFMVAMQLWQHTGETPYLDDAQRILYSALGYGQRPNGGFGCDTCAGAGTLELQPLKGSFEATWCCTMRGGEGLARAIEYSHWVDGNRLYLPYFGSAEARVHLNAGELTLHQTSGYPLEGLVELEVTASQLNQAAGIALYIPGWIDAEQAALNVNGEALGGVHAGQFVVLERQWRAGDRIELVLPHILRCETPPPHLASASAHAFWQGPLMLGIRNPEHLYNLPCDAALTSLGEGRYQVPGSSAVLAPIDDLATLEWEEAKCDKRQVLFND